MLYKPCDRMNHVSVICGCSLMTRVIELIAVIPSRTTKQPIICDLSDTVDCCPVPRHQLYELYELCELFELYQLYEEVMTL